MFGGRLGGAAPALLAVGLLAVVGSAEATTCVHDCAVAKRQCVKDARTVTHACKESCRANSDPTALGDCMRGCAREFREAKHTCRAVFKECKRNCVSGGTTTSTVQVTTTSNTVESTTTTEATTTTSSTLPTSPSPAFTD